MDRATELRLLNEAFDLAAQQTTDLAADIAHSPIERYIGEARFAQEQARVFGRCPLPVAHISELSGPNSFLTRQVFKLPLLLTRDGDGELHAFLNVCRHRGARIESGEAGCKRLFTCPYHAWSWDNRGGLRGVPHEADGFPKLAREERGLRRLPVAQAQGLVWVIADPDASDPLDAAQWLGELGADFSAFGLPDYIQGTVVQEEVQANWKLLVEGGLESYHFRVAHRDTIAAMFPDNLATRQAFGQHQRLVLPRNDIARLPERPQAEWRLRELAGLMYCVMPATQLFVLQDHAMWFQFEPLAIDRTRVRVAILHPADAADPERAAKHWAKNHAISLSALKEDFAIAEMTQIGLASRGNPSHLFGRFEGALDHFNRAVEALIDAD